MMHFNTPGAFAAHLRRVRAKLPEAESKGLAAGAEIIKREAKAVLGTYQYVDTGPFEPWEELAGRTKQERVQQGYPENEPLRRSGVLGDNIEASAEGRRAAVGVPDRLVAHPYRPKIVNIGHVALELEFGTPRIPPRAFLGLAGYRKGAEAAKLLGIWVAWALAGLPLGAKPRKKAER